jgi:hypothetical protein
MAAGEMPSSSSKGQWRETDSVHLRFPRCDLSLATQCSTHCPR